MNKAFICFLCLFLHAMCVLAQNTSGADPIPGSAKQPNEVEQLVYRITEGRNSETEKFEAIFNWVAEHMSYDYRAYYSTNGATKTNIRTLLKRKQGMCLDYASLMDTLCAAAGLTNVSVYGYAKDAIFDVNDSLYIDNHVWNAVRLQGLWYLYDVTWSSGEVGIEYTWFSKKLLKLFNKVKPRYKKKRLKEKGFPESDCGTAPAYYYKQRTLNKIWLYALSFFRLRATLNYDKKVIEKFYLLNPEIFGITHFPDDPVWALKPGSHRDFESDSSYYYLEDSQYKANIRKGVACSACDRSLALKELDALRELKQRSLVSNKRNHFITSYCEYEISRLYRKQQPGAAQTKAQLLDSSYAYLELCNKSLSHCRKNVELDYKLQKKKNQHKLNLLYGENKSHKAFIKDKGRLILEESRRNHELSAKTRAGSFKLRNKRSQITALRTEVKTVGRRKRSEDLLNTYQAVYYKKLLELDSLSLEIENAKKAFSQVLSGLVLNVWQKAIHYDSLIEPFRISTAYRERYKDNYKREVVEIRRRIPVYERNYAFELESVLFVPSQRSVMLGNMVITAIDTRHRLELELFRLATLLVRYERQSPDVLTDLKARMEKENREDCCWLEEKTPPLVSTYMGFDLLKLQQKRMELIINIENNKERLRVYAVNKELNRRRWKYKNIVYANISLVNKDKRKLKKMMRK